jgi:hypothetical protein
MSLSIGKAFEFIDIFDGSDSFEKWEKDVNLAIKQIKKEDTVSSEFLVLLLRRKLSGAALNFVEASDQSKLTDVPAVLALLGQEFNSAMTKAQLRQEMQAIRQQPKEPAVVYYDKKVYACIRLGDMSAEAKLMEVKSKLLPLFRAGVATCTEFSKLREALKELDAAHPNQVDESTAQTEVLAMTGSRACYICGSLSHLKKDCPKKACVHCKATGHASEDCFSLPQNAAKKKKWQERKGRKKNNTNANANMISFIDANENKDKLIYDRGAIFSICASIGNSMRASRVLLANSVKAVASYDSGSSLSALSGQFYDQFLASRHKLAVSDLPNVKVANGDVSKPRGQILIPVEFSGKLEKFVRVVKFFVIDNLPKKCLIGMDVIKHWLFDYPRDMAVCKGIEIQLFEEGSTASIFASSKVTLEPGCLVRIPVVINGDSSYVIRTKESAASIYYVDGRVDSSCEWIYAMNTTSRPFSIHKDECLYGADLVEEQSLLFVDVSSIAPSTPMPDPEIKIDIDPTVDPIHRKRMMDIVKSAQKRLDSQEWGAKNYEHRLKLKSEFVNRCGAYVYGPRESEFIANTTKEMLEKGICKPSRAVNVSPVVVAKHPRTGKLRFCVNYQKLNAVTQRENHLMPKVWEVLKKLAHSDWFSCLDLLSGFWQVRMAPESAPLTAFITNEGIFEMLFMPFGLLNASFSFQEMMEDVLKNTSALPYVDDCPIHSRGSIDEHLIEVEKVLGKLIDNGLRPNWSKCKFLYRKLAIMGHIVSRDEIQVDPARLSRLVDMPDPTNVKEVMLFLGLCAVYYKFIPKFQILAEPLFNLTRNGVEWNWSQECSAACKKIKEELINAKFISTPLQGKPFHIQVDSSSYAAGWKVYQLDDLREERIIGFGGKTFNKAQRRYFAGQQELLAIFLALEDYRWCVHGLEVFVHTDHRAWKWISNLKSKPARSVANWIMELLDYNPSIDWIPGKFNKVADALSRLWKADPEMSLFLDEVSKKEIVKQIHSDPVWGSHGAVKGTTDKVKLHVPGGWKGLEKDVEQVVRKCEECLENKPNLKKAKLSPIIADKPFSIVGIEFVGPFTASEEHEHRYCLIVVDYFTKWVELRPMSQVSAAIIVRKLKKLLMRFNSPQLIISDGALQFTSSELWKSFMRELGCVSDFSAAYHQQANGQVERFVKDVKPLITIKCQNNINRWPDILPAVMSAINSNVHSTTKMSAFKALYGYDPTPPIIKKLSGVEGEVKERHKQVLENIIESKEVQQQNYNNRLANQQKFNPGDLVWIPNRKPAHSFDAKNIPGEVVDIRGPDSYVVSSPGKALQNLNAKDLMARGPAKIGQAKAISTPKVIPSPSSSKALAGGDPLIGKEVSVWWDQYNQHYSGTVAKSDDRRKGTHIVRYNDGHDIYENLKEAKGKKMAEFELADSSKRQLKPNVSWLSHPKHDMVSTSEDDSDFVPDSGDNDTDDDCNDFFDCPGNDDSSGSTHFIQSVCTWFDTYSSL